MVRTVRNPPFLGSAILYYRDFYESLLLVRVLMFHKRVNPAYHVYFIGIHFSYTKFNEEFENPCLKNFARLRHRQF